MSDPVKASKDLSDKINALVKEVIMEGMEKDALHDHVSVAMSALIICLSQIATPFLDRTPEESAEFIKQRILEGIHYHRKLFMEKGIDLPQQRVH